MMISGIRTTESFYNLNRVSGASNVQSPQKVQATTPIPAIEETKPSPEEIAFARRNQNETSYDYAQKYNPTEEYTVEDHNSKLENLDVERAVSQMQRDRMLEQFRFFVGDKTVSANQPASSEEAAASQTARISENFNL